MTIIYEDNHLLAINKPAGILVQADQTGDATLTDWGKQYLKEKYAKPGAVYLHPAHRIDRPVSGAVLFGRTDKALSRLTIMFRDKKVEKKYLVLALAAPRQNEGTLRHYLWKDEKKNIVSAFRQPKPEAKESITRYRMLGKVGSLYLLEVEPLTGRAHQIRAQLAAIGCPILGDLKYGAPEPLPDASIGLHCRRMSLIHPVRLTELLLEADMPDTDWWRGIEG